MKKMIVEYKGMKNESTRIPLHMDDEEKVVYGCKLVFFFISVQRFFSPSTLKCTYGITTNSNI